MSVRLPSLVDLRDPNTLVQVLQEALKNVPEIHWFPVTFALPFAPFSLYHNIGKTPLGMVQDPMIDAIVWAEPDDRRDWGPQRVVLRSNAENAMMRVGLVV